MGGKELFECIRQKQINEQFEYLEKCVECKTLHCRRMEIIINLIRNFIKEEIDYGMDMSGEERQLAELEEKLRERDKKNKNYMI